LAILDNSDDSGWQAVSAAEGQGVFSATLKDFVCDGQTYN
jgi:hypothetical protein